MNITERIKVGDRVKLIRLNGFNIPTITDNIKVAKVLQIYKPTSIKHNKRYKIKIYGLLNTEGTNLTRWVSEDDITLDLEYYRNIKLHQLGL